MLPTTAPLQAALDSATTELRRAGCPAPVADAEALLAYVLDGDLPSDLEQLATTNLSPAEGKRFLDAVARRASREPLAYIIGTSPFRGLHLEVDKRVMIPQDRFGVFVDLAVTRAEFGARVHDVGTGSGGIALAVKSERPDLTVTGSDVSADSIEVARANALRLELDVEFTVASGIPAGDFDLILAHVPYQDTAGATLNLPPEEVDYQPHVAIFGGPDGLDVIRAVLGTAPYDTLIAVGHAPAQTDAVRDLFANPETSTADERSMTVGHRRHRPAS